MEAIATRLEAIATRVEAIAEAILEAIATTMEAIAEAMASRLEAIATRLEAIATRLEAIATRVEAIAEAIATGWRPSLVVVVRNSLFCALAAGQLRLHEPRCGLGVFRFGQCHLALLLVAFLLLVAMPGAPSSFLFVVVRPGAPSSVLAWPIHIGFVCHSFA